MNINSCCSPKYLVAVICTLATALSIAAEPGVLMQAVLGDDLHAAQLAIDGGAPVDAIDQAAGHTPLYAAVAPGGPRYREMIELLISKGARLDAIDTTTQLTPLVASMVVTERGPFAQLERSRAANIVKVLLNGGANPNQTLKAGESPLMLAVSMNNQTAVQLLLNRGANPNLRDANQSTALHVAYATERPALMIDALMAAGANPNLRDVQGKLPHELSPQFAPAEVATTQPPVAPATEPPKSSMTKWLIGGAVVATAIVGAAVLAHLVKEQKKKTSSSVTSANGSGMTLATIAQESTTATNPPSNANVTEGASYKLTTGVLPENGGRIELNPSSASYVRGTRVIATAIPAPGYSFHLWQLGCSGTMASCVTTVNKDVDFVAFFYRTSDGPPRGIRDQGGSICTMNGDRSFTCRDKKTGACTSGCKPSDSMGAGTAVTRPTANPIGSVGSSNTAVCKIENYRGPNDDPQVDSFCKNAYINQCLNRATGAATYRAQTTSVCKVLDDLLRSIGSVNAASYCSYCRQ